jgi:hypothetical protein
MTRWHKDSGPRADNNTSPPVEFIDPPAPHEMSAEPRVPGSMEHSAGLYSPPPVTSAPATDGNVALLTCVRLNCDAQGRPTNAERCPSCGHLTQLLRDHRWPRPVIASLRGEPEVP